MNKEIRIKNSEITLFFIPVEILVILWVLLVFLYSKSGLIFNIFESLSIYGYIPVYLSVYYYQYNTFII